MSRLVFVTQVIDPSHPSLGAAVGLLRALAERVDEVVVLGSRALAAALPANARFRSFEAPLKPSRGLRFEAALVAELTRGRPVAVVAHMCPIYAALAAPVARPAGVPVLLWFTHWRASRLLAWSERLSSAVLSVDAASFPLRSSKLVAAGHGIDLEEFSCTAPTAGSALRLVSLGRYSPAKGLPAVLRAIARVRASGIDARLAVYGPEPLPADRPHRHRLEQQVAELGLAGAVLLEDAVPRQEVPAILRESDALVNNMRAGAADKIVVECAAACRPAFSTARAYETLLPESLRFVEDDDEDLARRILDFAALSTAARAELGYELRARVAAAHSTSHWADAVLDAARRARGGSGGTLARG